MEVGGLVKELPGISGRLSSDEGSKARGREPRAVIGPWHRSPVLRGQGAVDDGLRVPRAPVRESTHEKVTVSESKRRNNRGLSA